GGPGGQARRDAPLRDPDPRAPAHPVRADAAQPRRAPRHADRGRPRRGLLRHAPARLGRRRPAPARGPMRAGARTEHRDPQEGEATLKALVTGGAGFIGSHLCDHLVAHGHSVVALDDLSTGRESNLEQLTGNPSFELVKGSILDKSLVDDVVAECDTVFHLAAAVGVHTIVDKPLESLHINLQGTENVVESAARRRARFMVASTSEVYGKNDADGLSEDADRVLGSPLKSRWSYAAAKGLDELVAYIYGEESGLP